MRKRSKPLLDDLQEKRRFWKLKEETLDHTVCETRWKMQGTCHITDYRKNEDALSVRSVNLRVSAKTGMSLIDCSTFLRKETVLFSSLLSVRFS